jgi:hypothetical protein
LFSIALLPAALQTAINVKDTAAAVVPVIELCPDPASVAVFAAGTKGIAADIDVPASFHIGAAGHDPASRPGALEISIVIDDVADATAVIVESSLAPSAADVFTPGKDLVATYAYVPAGLGVRPAWTIASAIRL